jgi:DNA-binding NtrC family response regulator
MTAHGTMETAVAAMQEGAYDYLTKPFDLDEALLLAERALTARRLTQEVTALRSGLKEVWEFGALVGRHPTMQEVYKAIGRVAATDVSVLLRGESGTGRKWWRARSTTTAGARGGPSWASRRRHPDHCSRSSCSAHEGAFTDARSAASASSSSPTAARCSSTRSATCRSSCR